MDVLVAVVDLNAAAWGQRATAAAAQKAASESSGTPVTEPVLTISAFVDQLLIFFNAFMILNKANQLCVIGADGTRAEYLWPLSMVHTPVVAAALKSSDDTDGMDTGDASAVSKRKGSKAAASASAAAAAAQSTAAAAAPSSLEASGVGVNSDLLRQINAFVNRSDATTVPPVESGSKLAGALSLGLCYLNRVHVAAAASPSGVKLRSRVLLFSICPDQSSQYVSMMNGIFATQKQSIPVDSCVISDSESLFLQQASHLTKGIYGRVPQQHQHALLQYLMFMYLSDATSRAHLILPTQAQVDLRATCFCHQQVVQLAVVCPVCLSLQCRSAPQCPVCGTRFAVHNVGGGAAPRAAPAQAAAAAATAVART